MYPNTSNSLVNILNDSTCANLSGPTVSSISFIYYYGDLE